MGAAQLVVRILQQTVDHVSTNGKREKHQCRQLR